MKSAQIFNIQRGRMGYKYLSISASFGLKRLPSSGFDFLWILKWLGVSWVNSTQILKLKYLDFLWSKKVAVFGIRLLMDS